MGKGGDDAAGKEPSLLKGKGSQSGKDAASDSGSDGSLRPKQDFLWDDKVEPHQVR